MDMHVKVLGILNIIGGAMGVCSALLMLLVFGLSAGAIAVDADADAVIAIPIIGLTGATLVSVLLAISLPGIVIGVGLIRFRPWARMAGIVLAIVSLSVVPFGTVVGAYGLWVLLRKDVEPLFVRSAG